MINTYLRKQIPAWLSRQVLGFGNKTKLFCSISMSVALSLLLVFCYEVPTKECELTVRTIFGSVNRFNSNVTIAFDCGKEVEGEIRSSVLNFNYSVSTENIPTGGKRMYFKGDTCEYNTVDLYSMMQEIMTSVGLPIRPVYHYLHVDYRERMLPRVYYYSLNGNKPKTWADSTRCVYAEGNAFFYNDHNYIRHKYVVAATDSVITLKNGMVNESHEAKWWNPYDISQTYVHFSYPMSDYPDPESSNSLTFRFNGATVFSEMFPKPDVISMDAITFTDPEKIRIIKRDGLWFHASFPQLANLQAVRMFSITTLLGFFIALTASILKNMILAFCVKKVRSNG